jgi:hypothetical protein
MSQENVELAKRGYRTLGNAFRAAGDLDTLRRLVLELFDTDVVISPRGCFRSRKRFTGATVRCSSL